MSLPTPYFQDDSVTIYHADCRDILPLLSGVTTVVTDPPYELGFMGKDWDKQGVSFDSRTWELVLNACLPGAPLLAFGGDRPHHRVWSAIEDAGWEIRTCLYWLFGSGFPKSLDISKSIDKRGGNSHLAGEIGQALKEARERRAMTASECDRLFCGGTTNWSWFEGRPSGQRPPTMETFNSIARAWPEVAHLAEAVAEAEREVVGQSAHKSGIGNATEGHYTVGGTKAEQFDITAPATDAAKEWQGYGTALKPAAEIICLAMKPLDGTFAHNALTHGVAGLNIDGARIGVDTIKTQGGDKFKGQGIYGKYATCEESLHQGRWPANLLLSHTPECKCVGTKKVKGDGHFPKSRYKETDIFGGGKGLPIKTGHEETYLGDEEIESWECTPDCPVRMLDEQSGERVHSAGHAREGSSNPRPQNYHGSVPNGWTERDTGVMFRFGDSGGASRFFYTAKSSRAERDQWLDDSCTVEYTVPKGQLKGGVSCKDVSMVLVESLRRAMSEYTETWRIGESGGSITGLCPWGSLSTILTVIKRITTSQILNSCPPWFTNAFIPVAFCEMMDGGNPAESAECSSESRQIITSASQESAHGASLVVSQMLSTIRDGAKWKSLTNTHSTVKPLDLMIYLVKLVLPPKNGVILDPFMGSGTTGLACQRLGVRFIGIDNKERNCEIAAKRMSQSVMQL